MYNSIAFKKKKQCASLHKKYFLEKKYKNKKDGKGEDGK